MMLYEDEEALIIDPEVLINRVALHFFCFDMKRFVFLLLMCQQHFRGDNVELRLAEGEYLTGIFFK